MSILGEGDNAGLCAHILTAFSFFLFLVTVPLSLCMCVKVLKLLIADEKRRKKKEIFMVRFQDVLHTICIVCNISTPTLLAISKESDVKKSTLMLCSEAKKTVPFYDGEINS